VWGARLARGAPGGSWVAGSAGRLATAAAPGAPAAGLQGRLRLPGLPAPLGTAPAVLPGGLARPRVPSPPQPASHPPTYSMMNEPALRSSLVKRPKPLAPARRCGCAAGGSGGGSADAAEAASRPACAAWGFQGDVQAPAARDVVRGAVAHGAAACSSAERGRGRGGGWAGRPSCCAAHRLQLGVLALGEVLVGAVVLRGAETLQGGGRGGC
jgi:hypothetical protein